LLRTINERRGEADGSIGGIGPPNDVLKLPVESSSFGQVQPAEQSLLVIRIVIPHFTAPFLSIDINLQAIEP
jgi:hypothetical protein